MTPRILIMAGGTGGHVFPALAVAQVLRAEGIEVLWLGTKRGMEADIVARAGFALSFIAIGGLRGKGRLSWMLAPYKLSLALVQSMLLLMKLRPAAVLGMGGFVAGPGGLAAWLLDQPLVIHEQNAVAGLTNKLLAPLAKKVLEAFPGSLPARRKAIHTGNPVRAEIAALSAPEERLRGRTGPLRLLVLGGSLGAQVLNECVPNSLQAWQSETRPLIRHQTGARNLEITRQLYREAGVEARIEPFITDMADAYAWADLVLCRAGALTIAELACAGVASILVPYPHAVDDHQTHNARYLVDAGAAVLVAQTALTPSHLGKLLSSLSAARERLLEMAVSARGRAQTQATARIAGLCREVAHV